MLGSREFPWLVFTGMPAGKGEWEHLLMGWVQPNLDILWAFVSMGPFLVLGFRQRERITCYWVLGLTRYSPDWTEKVSLLSQGARNHWEELTEESSKIPWGQRLTSNTLAGSVLVCLCPIGKALRSTARGSFPRRVRTNPKPRSYIVIFPPYTGPGHLAWSRHSWEGDFPAS